MVNNNDKKKILKQMLNEKTLFEMNGGAGITTPSIYGSAIPSTTKIGTGASTDPTIGSVVSNITGIKTSMSETQGALGATNFINLMRTLGKDSNVKTNQQLNGTLPLTVEQVQKKGYVGLPIYIADQISKVTGTMASGQVGIDKTVDDLENDASDNNLTLINESSFKELKATPGEGKNRYLTLYDLITNDQGQFLSADLEIILNQFSSLAQFKHLPSLQYLSQEGGKKSGGSTKKRSRKIRK
jgi:hypothetical protein